MFKTIIAIEGLVIAALFAILVVFQIASQNKPASPPEDKSKLFEKYDRDISDLKQTTAGLSQKCDTLKSQWAELVQEVIGALRTIKSGTSNAPQPGEKPSNPANRLGTLDNSVGESVLGILRRMKSVADIDTDKSLNPTDATTFTVRNTRQSYEDYSAKVIDTKIELDQWLDNSADTLPADAREVIEKAMDCYKDALLIWEMEFDSGAWEDTKDKVKDKPKERKKDEIKKAFGYITKYPFLSAGPYSRMDPEGRMLIPMKAIVLVWAQASDYIADADKLMNPGIR